MKGAITIYAPYDVDIRRLNEIKGVVEKEAKELGLRVMGPYARNDNRICVFYEDEASKCYIYVDDYEEPLNIEKMALTIRLMATITMAEMGKVKIPANI